MESRIYEKMQYHYFKPDGLEAGEKYPLLIYVHGAGGRGHDLSIVTFPYRLESYVKDHSMKMIIAAPLCEYDNWFSCFSELIAWVKYMSTSEQVDPDRVYVMGSSMGGFATWQLLECIPEVFAAAAPVCGGGMAWNAYRMKDIPIRAFHGALDTAVDPSESKKMVDMVNATGGHAELIMFPNASHNAWDPAIDQTDLMEWFLKQRRA